MIKLLVFLVAFAACYAVPSELHSHWNNFKLNHGKQYKSYEEETYRLQVFHENLKKIEEHNKLYNAGLSTFEMGITQFADLTDEEFVALTAINIQVPERNESAANIFKVQLGEELPEHVDWREKNAVNEVRNQLQCGSCWAFTAVEDLESIYYIKSGKMLTLSPQNLVDCSRSYGAFGCKGGFMNIAYEYIKDHGIMLDSDYPYTAKDEVCKFKPEKSALKVTGYKWVERNEKGLKTALANVGPIGIAVDSKEWKLYKSGIFTAKQPFKQLIHGVVAIGYGSENGVDYWLVRNSYGKFWGENGYIRLAINKGENIGVLTSPIYPTLD